MTMSKEQAEGALKNLDGQIESCRQLLAVFQEERGVYNQGRPLTKEELASTLDRKLKLVSLFERQRELFKEIGAELPEEFGQRRKERLRVLAGLLEQLIVIDQENERMMRDTSSSRRPAQPLNPFNSRPRPALQIQLPLMPFGPSSARPVEAPAPAAATARPAPAAVPAAASDASAKESALQKVRNAVKEFKAKSVSAPSTETPLPVRPKSHLRVYGGRSAVLANA